MMGRLLSQLWGKRLVFFQFPHLSPRQEGSEKRSLLTIQPLGSLTSPPWPQGPFSRSGKTAKGEPGLHKAGAAANWADVINCHCGSPGKPATLSALAASLGQPVAGSTVLTGALKTRRFRGHFRSLEPGCSCERAISLEGTGCTGHEGQRIILSSSCFKSGWQDIGATFV